MYTVNMHYIVHLVYVMILWLYIIAGDDSGNLIKTSKPVVLPESTEFAVPGFSFLSLCPLTQLLLRYLPCSHVATLYITCETKDAVIYYSTDGTDPTEDSKAIVEGNPLTIHGK